MNPAPQYVDLYLYAPSKNNSMIQAFGQADFTHGSLQVRSSRYEALPIPANAIHFAD